MIVHDCGRFHRLRYTKQIVNATAKKRHLHVIGICGVATSALAIAFHKKGWKVTGSDKGFFPPVSTELEKAGIAFYAGWHPEKMTEGGAPDIIIVGTASGSQNPETAAAEQFNIPLFSYPQIIGEYFAKEHSIVCAGTWGKTSSAALLSHILDQAEFDPSYMFGGVSLSHEASARLTESAWSVFEGDEYKSSPTDPQAKFFYYKPTHLLLTAVSWDHADLYPTEQAYFEAFEKLISGIHSGGVIVANSDNEGVMRVLSDARLANVRLVSYGRAESADYRCGSVTQTKDGLKFSIMHSDETYSISSPLIGSFQAENITGCFAMAHAIGVPPEEITAAIASFKGLKRRLEKRLDTDVAVIDDIAHSPEKASAVLTNLKEIYPGKVIAIFEPNIGGRQKEASAKYDNAFRSADIVLIPRLTKLKIAENEADRPLEGDELKTIIDKTHFDTRYIENDEELVTFLVSQAKKGDVIAFLGSHGFRGMIEAVVDQIKNIKSKTG